MRQNFLNSQPTRTSRWPAMDAKSTPAFAEYGIVLSLHLSQVLKTPPELIEEDNALLSGFGRQLVASLYEELSALEEETRNLCAFQSPIYPRIQTTMGEYGVTELQYLYVTICSLGFQQRR